MLFRYSKSWPKICLEWIQIIHFLQNPQQLLLNYFPFDHKGKSRMKGSSDSLLKRDHTTASFKARGTLFKKLNHNPITGHFLGCLDHLAGAWIEQINSQSHSSEDLIHVTRIYRIKLSPDNIIGWCPRQLMCTYSDSKIVFCQKAWLFHTTALQILLLSVCLSYLQMQ